MRNDTTGWCLLWHQESMSVLIKGSVLGPTIYWQHHQDFSQSWLQRLYQQVNVLALQLLDNDGFMSRLKWNEKEENEKIEMNETIRISGVLYCTVSGVLYCTVVLVLHCTVSEVLYSEGNSVRRTQETQCLFI